MRIPWNKTNWHDDWIVEHLLDYPSYRTLAQAHNELFGTNIAETTIGTHVKHDLGINKVRLSGEFLTDEQKKFLDEYYPHHSVKETTEEFNKRFGTKKRKYTILNYARRKGMVVDQDIVTKSKLDAAHAENAKRPYRKVGDIRFDGKRWVMKGEDGHWEQVGRVIWAKYHGQVKKGYAIIHLDGNQENYEISNLAEVPAKYLGLLQANGFRSADSEITKTGVLWCDLHELLKRVGAL